MSILTYSGIQLPYANCTHFSQDPVYDDVGRVDVMMTRFEILVTAVLNASYASMYGLTDEDGISIVSNSAQIMLAIRQRLEQPRMALSYTFNGIELIPQPQPGLTGTVDAMHGPKTDCQVFGLTNETFMVRFHVIAHYYENNITTIETGEDGDTAVTTNQRGSPVISNRWVEQVTLDASGYSTRTRVGKYVIRSDNAEGRTADEFRTGFAAVGVPDGFVRVSADYDLAPDSLGIQYRVVDKELFKLPPAPAFEADGRYIETGTKNAAVRYGQVRLSLRAPKDVSQVKLIETAVGVAVTKLIARGAKAPGLGDTNLVTYKGKEGFGIISQCVLVVSMYDNAVEIILEVMLAAQTVDGDTKKRIGGIAALTGGKFIAYTPGSETEDGTPTAKTPPYKVRGTAGLLLTAAAYFDPSLSTSDLTLAAARNTVADNTLVKIGSIQTGGASTIAPGEAGKRPEERKD